MSLTDQFI